MGRPRKSLILGAEYTPQTRSFTMDDHQAGLVQKQAQAMAKERAALLGQIDQHLAAIQQAQGALSALTETHAKALAAAAKLRYANALAVMQAYVPRPTRKAARTGLTAVEVAEIRRALACGTSGQELARAYNVSAMTISRIRNCQTYAKTV